MDVKKANELIMAGSTGQSSAARLIEIARSSFNKVSSMESFDNLSELNKFFNGGHFNLTGNEIKDVELVILLLASSNDISNQRLDRASKFLNLCDFLSSNVGTTIQRVVHYFSKALRDKIDREDWVTSSKTGGDTNNKLSHPDETMVSLSPALITCSLKLPFIQVTQFAGLQAIIESVASSKRVHFIDMAIRSGVQCISLMQALATRDEPRIELLKITAIGTTLQTKIEETVMVTNLEHIDVNLFELNDDESVVVSSRLLLRNTLRQPGSLESMMRMFKNLNPCIVVITEFETDHTSGIFLDRFSQALTFYTAFFNCLEDCMDKTDENRKVLEGSYLGEEIKNIVAAGNDDRIFMDMKIEEWRSLFTSFGMMETELSSSALYQADLVAKQFDPGNSCSCNMNEKSLVVNWKGTPIVSLSTWKLC
ncbi:DELLA protein GAI1-like [Hibiscus syriacus]|uniref:DELLA protein GAI1-like n=1 Tax=Hibiscus syriacus TaxID=106335 RepID=UPI00192261A8|nr:DELLA protein GAI1-like [Hibiscus syriacus]